MSLARALTKRYRANAEPSPIPSSIGRAMSRRHGLPMIDRAQISLPTELLSTTNSLAYDAPDLHENSPLSSASSTKSYDDSDNSPTFSSSSSISTADSSRESSPTSVVPNHLSAYFQTRSSVGSSRKSNMSSDADVPAIPTRAPSHTKKSHQTLARKRSESQIRQSAKLTSDTVPPPATVRSSVEIFAGKHDTTHPFEAELAQVNELAEEFNAKEVIMDEEERYLTENGLQKFCAEDYMQEIQGLFGGVFDDRSFPLSSTWI